MSKKLIAVASAAVLALSALVGIAPANATAVGATFTGAGSTDGTSASDPSLIDVPSGNFLTGKVDTLTVAGILTNDVITLTASANVRVIQDLSGLTATANRSIDVTKLGATSVTYTADADASVTFEVFTTSTTAGTLQVAVTRAGSAPLSYSRTLHIKGNVGPAYNVVDVSGVPATLATNGTAVVSFKVTDVFGNPVEGSDVATTSWFTATSGLATFAATAGTTDGWDATAKVYKGTITALSTNPFLVGIQIGGASGADPEVVGFPEAKNVVTDVVNYAGASSQVANLTAQIAALQVIVDRKVTKKRYNTLARKWNRAFPSQKVWVKP
jgi:hypothetical protein